MRLLAMCVGLCLVFLFVWERVDMVRVGYQVERLKQEKTILERERDQLRVKVSALSAPDRIAKVARPDIGVRQALRVGVHAFAASLVVLARTGLRAQRGMCDLLLEHHHWQAVVTVKALAGHIFSNRIRLPSIIRTNHEALSKGEQARLYFKTGQKRMRANPTQAIRAIL